MNNSNPKTQTKKRGEVGVKKSWQPARPAPEEMSFRLLPSLVLLSSFSRVSLSNRLLFWSFWWGTAALFRTKSAVLLTLSLSWPERKYIHSTLSANLVAAGNTEDVAPFKYRRRSCCALCSSCADSWRWVPCFVRPGWLVRRPCARPWRSLWWWRDQQDRACCWSCPAMPCQILEVSGGGWRKRRKREAPGAPFWNGHAGRSCRYRRL